MSEINILVVDDEKEIADLIEIYLVSDGYKVFKAENAARGLEIIEKENIHLVLLDIMMWTAPAALTVQPAVRLKTAKSAKKFLSAGNFRICARIRITTLPPRKESCCAATKILV